MLPLRPQALVRFPPRRSREGDAFSQHGERHAHDNHRGVKRTLGLQIAIGDRVGVHLVPSDRARVHHDRLALQHLPDARRDHLGHAHVGAPRVDRRQRLAVRQLVEVGGLQLADGALGLLAHVDEPRIGGVVGHGLELDAHPRLRLGIQRGPLQVHDGSMSRVHARLDHAAIVAAMHLQHLLVVMATEDDRKNAHLGHLDILGHVLVSERNNLGHARMLAAHGLHRCGDGVQHRDDGSVRMTERFLPVHHLPLAAADAEAQERDLARARRPVFGGELPDEVLGQRGLETRDVRVQPLALKLGDAMCQL
mmetsp:Transcript_31890/g.91905  ORF Transcript_31890/g.91905 Transcript_31890/m.91905 type:complete len:308 (+) Transcript_31890:619-1542(+)